MVQDWFCFVNAKPMLEHTGEQMDENQSYLKQII